MAVNAVRKYLKVQNRPYSANDIVMNLHKEFGKTAIQKALDQLVADEQIYEKVYGKQKVYCIVQETSYEPDELARIQNETEAHGNEVNAKRQEVEQELRAMEAALSALKSRPSLLEARKEKEKLLKSINDLNEKLDKLLLANGTQDLSEVKKRAQEQTDRYSRAYLKRKRLCMEMIDCILEGYPGSKSALYEEIGIDPTIVQ